MSWNTTTHTHPRTHSRREFVATLAGAGAAGIAFATAAVRLPQAANAQEEATLWSGGLGLNQEQLEALTGPGSEADGVIEYPNPTLEDGRIYVFYRDGIVSHLELDFTGTANGGLHEDTAWTEAGAYGPFDATLLGTYRVGTMSMTANVFYGAANDSPVLAEYLGSGRYIATLEQEPSGDGPVTPLVIRATLSAEAADIVTVTPTGDPGGLGVPTDTWTAVYGEPTVPQRGLQYEVPPFEQTLVDAYDLGISEIDALVDAGIPIDEAVATVGSWLPADAVHQGSFYAHATPNGPIALRIQTWELPTQGLQASVWLYELGPEERASVGRIMMAFEQTVTTQAAEASPAASPVATPIG